MKDTKRHNSIFLQCNKGNALFLILIAVALFAALSYAVTKSSRGGDSSKEENSIKAAQILEYGSFMQSSIQRMLLLNGTTEATISFDHPDWGHTFYRYAIPQPDSNKVFSATGGGVDFGRLDSFGTVSFSALNRLMGIGCDNHDDSCVSLLMAVEGLDLEVCEAINRQALGTSSVVYNNIALPYTGGSAARYFKGVYVSTNTAGYIVDEVLYAGKINACLEDTYPSLGQQYTYYHVLIER